MNNSLGGQSKIKQQNTIVQSRLGGGATLPANNFS
jgi:hypothetical protein